MGRVTGGLGQPCAEAVDETPVKKLKHCSCLDVTDEIRRRATLFQPNESLIFSPATDQPMFVLMSISQKCSFPVGSELSTLDKTLERPKQKTRMLKEEKHNVGRSGWVFLLVNRGNPRRRAATNDSLNYTPVRK